MVFLKLFSLKCFLDDNTVFLISEVYNKNSHFNGFSKTGRHVCNGPIPYNEQNFDLDKSRQTFHHSLKEHHKISNIPKFRCEMFVLRAGN